MRIIRVKGEATTSLTQRVGAPDGQHLVASAMGFDPTVERLKQALKDQDLWLIHEIDPRMLLQRTKAGGCAGTRQPRKSRFQTGV